MSRKYQIQAGDTLFAVSKRFYGEPTYFGLIAVQQPDRPEQNCPRPGGLDS